MKISIFLAIFSMFCTLAEAKTLQRYCEVSESTLKDYRIIDSSNTEQPIPSLEQLYYPEPTCRKKKKNCSLNMTTILHRLYGGRKSELPVVRVVKANDKKKRSVGFIEGKCKLDEF